MCFSADYHALSSHQNVPTHSRYGRLNNLRYVNHIINPRAWWRASGNTGAVEQVHPSMPWWRTNFIELGHTERSDLEPLTPINLVDAAAVTQDLLWTQVYVITRLLYHLAIAGKCSLTRTHAAARIERRQQWRRFVRIPHVPLLHPRLSGVLQPG